MSFYLAIATEKVAVNPGEFYNLFGRTPDALYLWLTTENTDVLENRTTLDPERVAETICSSDRSLSNIAY